MEGWERIKLIMEQEGYNKNSFSATIGLNNNVTITRLINEERKPSRMTCEKIAQRSRNTTLIGYLQVKEKCIEKKRKKQLVPR